MEMCYSQFGGYTGKTVGVQPKPAEQAALIVRVNSKTPLILFILNMWGVSFIAYGELALIILKTYGMHL